MPFIDLCLISRFAVDARNIFDIVPQEIRFDTDRPLDGLRDNERPRTEFLADLLLRVLDIDEIAVAVQDDEIRNFLPLPAKGRNARFRVGSLAVVIRLERLQNRLKTSCESGCGTSMTPFTI